jgi:hypothetical protein
MRKRLAKLEAIESTPDTVHHRDAVLVRVSDAEDQLVAGGEARVLDVAPFQLRDEAVHDSPAGKIRGPCRGPGCSRSEHPSSARQALIPS